MRIREAVIKEEQVPSGYTKVNDIYIIRGDMCCSKRHLLMLFY